MKEPSAVARKAHWLDAWHVEPSANRNYDFIDGLRGLAILMVVACHTAYARADSNLTHRYVLSFFGVLGKGVMLFYTLSGFVIALPFWKRKAGKAAAVVPNGYGWRRFWKIYPPLALSVMLLVPVYLALYGDASLYIRTALQWLSGMAFFIPVSGKFNPVMWSLVVEIHFYLVLPLLFLASRRLSAKACLWIIPLFLFAVPEILHWQTGLAPTLTPEISDPYGTGLSWFCLGVALAGVEVMGLWNRNYAKFGEAGWFVLLFAILAIAWVRLDPESHGKLLPWALDWLFVLGTGCLLCYAPRPDHPRARWLCSPWLRWTGIVSYEWYLFHQPMLICSREIFGSANGNVVKYAFILGAPVCLSLAFSALFYRVFSLPILKYGRARRSAQK